MATASQANHREVHSCGRASSPRRIRPLGTAEPCQPTSRDAPGSCPLTDPPKGQAVEPPEEGSRVKRSTDGRPPARVQSGLDLLAGLRTEPALVGPIEVDRGRAPAGDTVRREGWIFLSGPALRTYGPLSRARFCGPCSADGGRHPWPFTYPLSTRRHSARKLSLWNSPVCRTTHSVTPKNSATAFTRAPPPRWPVGTHRAGAASRRPTTACGARPAPPPPAGRSSCTGGRSPSPLAHVVADLLCQDGLLQRLVGYEPGVQHGGPGHDRFARVHSQDARVRPQPHPADDQPASARQFPHSLQRRALPQSY